MPNYPDIYFSPEYQELFKDTAFGGEPCHFNFAGIDYRYYKRRIPNTPYFDIVSPYGYSGPVRIEDGVVLDQCDAFELAFMAWCSEQKVVAEFARLHPFEENDLYVGTRNHAVLKREHEIFYIDLTQSEDDIWKGFDKGCKSTTKWGQGHIGAVTIGKLYLSHWLELYEKTMQRQDANSSYHFKADFFMDANRLLKENIKLFQAWDYDKVIAAALILRSGDYAHYFLSASDEELGKNRTNALLWEAIKWAKSQGCKIFNLGGGLKAGDSLESFKRSFTKASRPFYTYRKVHNQEVYNKLCQEKGVQPNNESWFPAYRRV